MIHFMNRRRSSRMKHEWKTRHHADWTVLTAGKEQAVGGVCMGGGALCLLCHHTGIIVMLPWISLPSSSSSLGWCGGDGSWTLAAQCHFRSWACPPTTTAIPLLPDRRRPFGGVSVPIARRRGRGGVTATPARPRQKGGRGRRCRNLRVLSREEMAQKKKQNKKTTELPKKKSVVERSVVFSSYLHLTVHPSLQLSLTSLISLYTYLFIYLHSHLKYLLI